MKNKANLKRVIRIFATIAALFCLLYVTSLCLMRNNTYDKYQTFKKRKTDYDVLFLGTSHVLNGLFPMQLWEDYGITSYNLAYHNIDICPSYWVLEEAVRYHTPKIAIVDIFDVNKMWNGLEKSRAHEVFDNFPLSRTKIRIAWDLFSKSADRAEFLFPFVSYHNRWSQGGFSLTHGIRRLAGTYTPHLSKGADLRIAVKCSEVFNMDVNPYEGTESAGMAYAKKCISFCREHGIIPVFMFVPYPAQQNLDEWTEAFLHMLAKEGVPFIDMREGVVDFDTDQYDQNSHLNPSGARKVTDAIGRFLCEEAGLKSHKGEASYALWGEDYEDYRNYILGEIERQNDFKTLLMMLNNAEVYAEVSARSGVQFDAVEQKLLFHNQSDIRFAQNDSQNADVAVRVFLHRDGSLLFQKNFATSFVISE